MLDPEPLKFPFEKVNEREVSQQATINSHFIPGIHLFHIFLQGSQRGWSQKGSGVIQGWLGCRFVVPHGGQVWLSVVRFLGCRCRFSVVGCGVVGCSCRLWVLVSVVRLSVSWLVRIEANFFSNVQNDYGEITRSRKPWHLSATPKGGTGVRNSFEQTTPNGRQPWHCVRQWAEQRSRQFQRRHCSAVAELTHSLLHNIIFGFLFTPSKVLPDIEARPSPSPTRINPVRTKVK